MDDRRVRISRHCLEEICNGYYLKGALCDDDFVLMNMTEIVSEAFAHICEGQPFSFERLQDICDTSRRKTELDKFAFALSTLLELLLSWRLDAQESPLSTSTPPEEDQPSTSALPLDYMDTEIKTEDDDFDGLISQQPTSSQLVLDPADEIKTEDEDYFYEDPMPVLESHYGEMEDEKYGDDVAGPSGVRMDSNQGPSNAGPSSNPNLWIREIKRPGAPIKCDHCNAWFTPGNAMAAHMSMHHADLLPKLRERYAQAEAESVTARTKNKYSRPQDVLLANNSAAILKIREKYAEKAKMKFSDRYLPKAPRPRKITIAKRAAEEAASGSTANPPTERGRAPRKTLHCEQQVKKRANRPCSICRCPITENKLRDEHTRKAHPDDWMKIPKCGEPSCDFRSSNLVFRENHDQNYPAQHELMAKFRFPAGTRCIYCELPGHPIRTLAEFISHTTAKHKEQMTSKECVFYCGSCSHRFYRLYALANHWVEHSCIPRIKFATVVPKTLLDPYLLDP